MANDLLTDDFVLPLGCPPDLVGVVACNGTRGELAPGEGTIGIPRALLGAGAKAVWTTLWAVNPDSAREFVAKMDRAFWQDGETVAESVRSAQLWMLRYGGAELRHPRYWAPWIVCGQHSVSAR